MTVANKVSEQIHCISMTRMSKLPLHTSPERENKFRHQCEYAEPSTTVHCYDYEPYAVQLRLTNVRYNYPVVSRNFMECENVLCEI